MHAVTTLSVGGQGGVGTAESVRGRRLPRPSSLAQLWIDILGPFAQAQGPWPPFGGRYTLERLAGG